jgi:integrase/recombinase XerD
MMNSKAYLDSEDIRRMEQAETCLRDKLLIRLLFHLGCRISEALALTVDDVDLNNGLVTILHLKTRIKITCPSCNVRLAKTNLFCPGCGKHIERADVSDRQEHKRRTLPVDASTLVMLRDFIQQGGPIAKNGKRLIFGINRHRAWQIIKECADKAGLPHLVNPETGKVHSVSPHRLRDAFAVHAVKRNDTGDGLRLLQEHLGHASFNTTARYRKVAGEEHRKWYKSLWEEENNGSTHQA